MGDRQSPGKKGILTLFMIMNARQHIYVKIMQFAAVLCQCVACHNAMEKRQVQRGGGRGNA